MTVHLSPSEHHKHVMSQTVPSLRYDGGDVKSWQARLRRKLRGLVGEMPTERCALRPRTLWQREHPLGSIEKLTFTAESHADVSAYLCLPIDIEPPFKVVICLQGHSTGMHNSIGVQFEDDSKSQAVENDRDFAIQCMRRGFAALCIEQRAFGDRCEQNESLVLAGRCHSAAMQALLLGRTLIGERVYDVDRGIDYLATRGDVDMKNIGVMGNSGGGTISMFAAALLPRLAFAMPSCYFCTFGASIMSVHHCACNFVPGLLKYAEMSDIMGLFAPKPVTIVAGRDDDIFPITATRRAFKDLQRIYNACDAGDRCRLVVGEGGHRFYADDAWPVMLKQISKA